MLALTTEYYTHNEMVYPRLTDEQFRCGLDIVIAEQDAKRAKREAREAKTAARLTARRERLEAVAALPDFPEPADVKLYRAEPYRGISNLWLAAGRYYTATTVHYVVLDWFNTEAEAQAYTTSVFGEPHRHHYSRNTDTFIPLYIRSRRGKGN